MSAPLTPVVLVVDDRVEDGRNLAVQISDRAELLVREPSEVVSDDLKAADLILVDYELTDWPDSNAKLTTPPNGLALASVLRQRIDGLEAIGAKGVALYSGQVEHISANLPPEVRAYAVARLNNLEWVFEKNSDASAAGIISLATAVATLPTSWPEGTEAVEALHALLGLDTSVSFGETAADDIAACHPPIHELSTATHALAVVRWLAQRILPYPAFLMDRWALAARLRVDPADLGGIIDGTQLGEELGSVAYNGALCDLFGQHWWRAGVDDLIFDWTEGVGGVAEVRSAIERRAGQVTFLEGDLVPVIDDSYRPIGVASIEESVRLRPDDWPVFADEAWATVAAADGSDRLRGLVVPADQGSLDE